MYMRDSNVLLENFHNFLNQSTKQLNETKGDMRNYIALIESRSTSIDMDYLTILWDLQKLITFEDDPKGFPPHIVSSRDSYIKPFSYDPPTSGGPAAGGSYARIGSFRSGGRAHMTCENIGGLLTRLENV
jgi:hypothetical protein